MTGYRDNQNRPETAGTTDPRLRRPMPQRPAYDIALPDDPSRLTIVGAPLDIPDPPAPATQPHGAGPAMAIRAGGGTGSYADRISAKAGPPPATITSPVMQDLRHSRPLLGQSRRRYTFMLTAFADAMFQLLIFFMLATNLDAFSLLTISPGAEAGGMDEAESPAQPIPAGQIAMWTLSRNSITAGGQRFGFDQLPQLAKGALIAGTEQILLITREDADVQAVVHVLEALNRNGIDSVQIIAAHAYEQGAGK